VAGTLCGWLSSSFIMPEGSKISHKIGRPKRLVATANGGG